MVFALRHLVEHGLSRVVYVAPFTAIIEQTADVLREALGDAGAVLEHHSAFAPDGDDDMEDERTAAARAAENWDRPVVVTTAVQLFESLFAADPRRCRKVHRLARAVVILDEAQAIPLPVLRPSIAAMAELARGYGATVVLCTATQPAVTRAAGATFPEAMCDVREIAPNPPALQRRLARVRFEQAGVLSDAAIAARLKEAGQGLVIVNARRHARELFGAMDGTPGRRHLTTTMTGAHRRSVLQSVRADLAEKRPCALVATSLIEAGVDISFPLVMRALAGLDSIAQAAGRCNRNGEMGERGGTVVLFEPEPGEGRAPPKELQRFADVARRVLADYTDPLCQDALNAYFRELYWQKGDKALDSRTVRIGDGAIDGVLKVISQQQGGAHASVAEAFRLIDQETTPILVPMDATPHGAPAELIASLKGERGSLRGLLRKLQPFTVPVPRRIASGLLAAGSAEIIGEATFGQTFVCLTNPSIYHEESGLDWSDPTFREAESLML